MKKYKGITVLLSLMLLLTSCNSRSSKQVVDENVKHITSPEVYTYSKNLADAAIDYYLGDDYDEAYEAPLVGLPQLVGQERMIQFDNDLWAYVYEYIRTSADYIRYLDAYKALDEESRVGYFDAYDIEIIADLEQYVHKDGVVPNMQILDTNYKPTSAYTEWFLQKAQDTGQLDTRIKYTHPGGLTVSSNDCSKSKGGNTFKVFGVTHTIPSDEIGIIAEDIKNSPEYQLESKSYRFYDTGQYTATYETVDGTAGSEKVSITVTFKYIEPTTGDYPDALSKFIEGVTDFKINLQGGK